MRFPRYLGSLNGSSSSSSSSSVLGKRRRVGLVYDERMCSHSVPSKREIHPENPDRIRAIWNKLMSAGIPQKCVVFNAKEVEDKYVAAVHTNDHIKLIKNISSKKPASQRNRVAAKYNSIYFNEGSSKSAYLAAGSVLEVAEKVAKGELDSAFAIVRPPGHHAENCKPMGFCLYNNVAIAASFLLNQKELGISKILIVDWDVHHGNGTQKMFWKDPRVLVFSVHRHDNGEFYPAGDDGSHIMMGEGLGLGYNINVPWESGQCGDADYIAVWDHILVPVAKEFKPDIILISAGFDAAVGDPLGGCLVTPDGFSIMLKKLMEFSRGKIVMALEGGYNLNSTANSVLACVQVLLEDKPNVESMAVDPFESSWRVIKAVREQFSAFWPASFNQAVENQNLTIAHSKEADNDEDTLLKTSSGGNEDEEELIDEDIVINPTSENLTFTLSLPAHCKAASNDEDIFLETSAERYEEEEEEEFIEKNIQANPTFENLPLTFSPPTHCKAANNDEDTHLETSIDVNAEEEEEEFIIEEIQINPTCESLPFASSPPAHCKVANNDEDILLDTFAEGNEEEETPSSKQKKKVSTGSRVVNEIADKDTSIFVPAGSIRVDDSCTKDKSFWDFWDHVPPAVADATHKMSTSELLAEGDRAMIKVVTSYYEVRERLFDTEKICSELKDKVQFLERQASVDAKVIQDLRKQLGVGSESIKVRLQEEKDRRAWAEAERSKLAEKSTELVGQLTSLTASMQAMTDRLAEKEREVLEFEHLEHLSDKVRDFEGVVLSRDIELAVARSQIESLQAALHDSNADRDAAKQEKRDTLAAVPPLVMKLITSSQFLSSLGHFMQCTLHLGRHEVTVMLMEAIPSADPSLLIHYDPDAWQKLMEADETVRHNKYPFLDQITADLDRPISEILQLEPE